MTTTIEPTYFSVTTDEGNHAFTFEHVDNLEATKELVIQGIKEELQADEVTLTSFELPKWGREAKIEFTYIDGNDDEVYDGEFYVVPTAIYRYVVK